jgi:coenzyme F420-0:L-glutamate ligase / coenzyme F420-1:gamma-L-glutamate ligase
MTQFGSPSLGRVGRLQSGRSPVTLTGLTGMPLVQPGDDLGRLIVRAAVENDYSFADGDVVVVAAVIVSKAEDRFMDLREMTPSAHARELADVTGKDPRLVEAVLRESEEVSRAAPGVLIVRHRLGFTSAVAGIDHSNVGEIEDVVLLLPVDPDGSARAIRDDIRRLSGAEVGVIVSDTHGRPFRIGNVGVAIGVAGLQPVVDARGSRDLFGRELVATLIPIADQLATAACLVSGETDEGIPVVIARGVLTSGEGSARELIRPAEQDLYR